MGRNVAQMEMALGIISPGSQIVKNKMLFTELMQFFSWLCLSLFI